MEKDFRELYVNETQLWLKDLQAIYYKLHMKLRFGLTPNRIT